MGDTAVTRLSPRMFAMGKSQILGMMENFVCLGKPFLSSLHNMKCLAKAFIRWMCWTSCYLAFNKCIMQAEKCMHVCLP